MNINFQKVLTLAVVFTALNGHAACLKIGLIGEFNNRNGATTLPFGDEIKNGAQMAKKDLTTCVEFEVIDFGSSIANIDGYIRKAARNGTHYFVGLGTTDQALAAQSAIDSTGSILISPTASSTEIVKHSPRTIMMFPDNTAIAKALVSGLKERGVKKTASIFASNDSYSRDMNAEFHAAAVREEIKIVEIEVRAGRIEISDRIERLRSEDINTVFVPLYELDAAKVLAELSRKGIHSTFVGTDSWGTYSNVIRALLSKSKFKALLPVIYDPTFANEVNRKFVQRYKEHFSRVPTDLAAFSYDGVILATRIHSTCASPIANSDLPQCLQRAGKMNSTMGPLHFENRSVSRKIALQQFRIGDDQ